VLCERPDARDVAADEQESCIAVTSSAAQAIVPRVSGGQREVSSAAIGALISRLRILPVALKADAEISETELRDFVKDGIAAWREPTAPRMTQSQARRW